MLHTYKYIQKDGEVWFLDELWLVHNSDIKDTSNKGVRSNHNIIMQVEYVSISIKDDNRDQRKLRREEDKRSTMKRYSYHT